MSSRPAWQLRETLSQTKKPKGLGIQLMVEHSLVQSRHWKNKSQKQQVWCQGRAEREGPRLAVTVLHGRVSVSARAALLTAVALQGLLGSEVCLSRLTIM